MLTLTFLGVGSAFAKRNYQSNALVEAWGKGSDAQARPDETLLVDFGSSGPRALHALKEEPGFEYLDNAGAIDYSAIGNIFLTHQHGDHYGGLEELAIVNLLGSASRERSGTTKPRLIGVGALLSKLWDQSLSGALEASNGRRAKLTDYFRVNSLAEPVRPVFQGDSVTEKESRASNANSVATAHGPPHQFMLLDRYVFAPFATNHIWIEKPFDWPSYGLTIEDTQTGKTAFFSGDTRFDRERFEPMMARANCVFHEVQLEADTAPVHTLLTELRTLPPSVREKMILYHYGDSWDCGSYEYVASEFAGFAQPRRRYVLFD